MNKTKKIMSRLSACSKELKSLASLIGDFSVEVSSQGGRPIVTLSDSQGIFDDMLIETGNLSVYRLTHSEFHDQEFFDYGNTRFRRLVPPSPDTPDIIELLNLNTQDLDDTQDRGSL